MEVAVVDAVSVTVAVAVEGMTGSAGIDGIDTSGVVVASETSGVEGSIGAGVSLASFVML